MKENALELSTSLGAGSVRHGLYRLPKLPTYPKPKNLYGFRGMYDKSPPNYNLK